VVKIVPWPPRLTLSWVVPECLTYRGFRCLDMMKAETCIRSLPDVNPSLKIPSVSSDLCTGGAGSHHGEPGTGLQNKDLS
jgi:hypothetical protein